LWVRYPTISLQIARSAPELEKTQANFSHTEERNNVDVSFREVLVYAAVAMGTTMAVGQAQDIAPVNSGANPILL